MRLQLTPEFQTYDSVVVIIFYILKQLSKLFYTDYKVRKAKFEISVLFVKI